MDIILGPIFIYLSSIKSYQLKFNSCINVNPFEADGECIQEGYNFAVSVLLIELDKYVSWKGKLL